MVPSAAIRNRDVAPRWHPERMRLGRLAWLVTTICCLVAAAIVLIRGDRGYAAVAFAVALSAAINLLPERP